MASQVDVSIPKTGQDNSTKSIRDNFAEMKHEIEALQTSRKYKRVMYVEAGWPNNNYEGSHGPRGPGIEKGTLWFSTDAECMCVWVGGTGDISADNWKDITHVEQPPY